MKAWPVLGIALIEGILIFAHWFVYHTFVVFFAGYLGPAAVAALGDALFLLAFSFIVAALLSFRFTNPLVNAIYKIGAVWLGFLHFFFLAACLSWLVWLPLQLTHMQASPYLLRPRIAAVFFTLAILTVFYGLLNARWIRIRHVPVQLPNLPASWRGRKALLLSDLHLGNINRHGFMHRIASMASRLNPDIIFISGDVFDGTMCDQDSLAAPFKRLDPPFGIYFSTGNHDEFGGVGQYLAALTGAGVRVLSNEKVLVDGLQIMGIPYHDSTFPIRMKATLHALRPEEGQASILLNHVPNRLPIVEQAGVSLQLSGHTHGGQIFPFSWFTRRIFGKFTYGLQSFGALQVYTSSGAGTWGPPMRIGTEPEIVLLQFE